MYAFSAQPDDITNLRIKCDLLILAACRRHSSNTCVSNLKGYHDKEHFTFVQLQIVPHRTYVVGKYSLSETRGSVNTT